jgi:hypothetical protein
LLRMALMNQEIILPAVRLLWVTEDFYMAQEALDETFMELDL